MRQLLRAFVPIVVVVASLIPSAVWAAQVRGAVTAPPQAARARAAPLGYTRTQVAAPAKALSEGKRAVALFLRSKESLPIPDPTTHLEIAIHGMRLTPEVAACAVDAKVVFTNREREPVTVVIDGAELGPIPPGESRDYLCTPGGQEDLRRVRIVGRRFSSGSIYVGQIGVAGRPNESGYFSLNAPQGTYELQFVTEAGIVGRRPVEIARSDVSVGVQDLTSNTKSEPGSKDK